jgi:hypothetical protein
MSTRVYEYIDILIFTYIYTHMYIYLNMYTGRCPVQLQGVIDSSMSQNIPVVTDTPWAIGGSHRKDYGGSQVFICICLFICKCVCICILICTYRYYLSSPMLNFYSLRYLLTHFLHPLSVTPPLNPSFVGYTHM